jgi:hypothetical protein
LLVIFTGWGRKIDIEIFSLCIAGMAMQQLRMAQKTAWHEACMTRGVDRNHEVHVMKKLVIFFCMAWLYACGSSSPYVEATSARDYGYSESRITDNRYRVSFRGDADTSSDEVKDMALLRAAEITLRNDYDWFRVLTQETQQDSTQTPVTTTRRGADTQQVFRDCGPRGCTTTITPAYTGADVVAIREQDRYTTSIEIVMGDGDLEDPTTAYDATELRRSLAARY